jgi:hypothetical protein
MSRRKKTSAMLVKGEQRLAGLKSIGVSIELGNDITSDSLENDVANLRLALENYNTLLSKVDEASNAIEQAEKQVAIATENILLGVKIKFGKDSSEYEMAGGTRSSDYRRRRETTPAAEVAMA